MTITRVGVLGGGPLGHAFARALGRVGVATVIAGDRPAPLPVMADPTMPTAVSVRRAADEDIVFLSVLWSDLRETLSVIADWESRILIDATNPVLAGVEAVDLGGKTSSEVVSELAPGAQLVKAFNTLPPDLLAAEPALAGGRRVVFFSGDHLRAKVEVGRLITRLGFAGIDLGSLATGGRLQQFPDGPLWSQNLIAV